MAEEVDDDDSLRSRGDALRRLRGSTQKMSGSMSAKTGTAWYPITAVADADIVYGGTSTSSPGPTPAAPTAAKRPDVLELNETACFAPTSSAHACSNARTRSPP